MHTVVAAGERKRTNSRCPLANTSQPSTSHLLAMRPYWRFSHMPMCELSHVAIAWAWSDALRGRMIQQLRNSKNCRKVPAFVMRVRLLTIGSSDVRGKSFGTVFLPGNFTGVPWDCCKGTLWDPAIFGPKDDWKCACGKYSGREFDGFICDICGTRLGVSRKLQSSRFGHIELTEPVSHPLLPDCLLSTIPVLPIAYRSESDAVDLNYLYNRVLLANAKLEGRGDRPDHQESQSLSIAILQLFINESSTDPVTRNGRKLRSILHYAFSGNQSFLDIGIFMFALCIKCGLIDNGQ